MTKSTELANSFKSGSLLPILEQMVIEYPEHGLQENAAIDKVTLASYCLGIMLAHFKPKGMDYGFLTNHIKKIRKGSDMRTSLQRTLIGRNFANNMLTMPEGLQRIYADIVLLDDAEINEPIMLAGMLTEMKHIERERIGERIKQLREEQGITQEQLAERTGLLKQNISRIEQGRYSTGQDILSKIAFALGRQLDFM